MTEQNSKEHVYYIVDENKLSIVDGETHARFSKWIIGKYSDNVDDFYQEYKSQNEIVLNLTQLFLKDIIYLGEL